jgi:hypothetical protein
MACNYQNKIVTSGLVVCLDAANKRSYPGTGTIWYDRSSNNNHATLVAGPVYSGINQGTIAFDGTDDYASVPCSQLTGRNTTTLDMYANWRSLDARMFCGFTTYTVYTPGGALGYNNGASNCLGISAATVTALGLKNKFHHYAFVMNSTGNLSANKIYIDGVSVGALTAVAGADGLCGAFTTGMRVCDWNNGGGYNGDHIVSSFRIYNRELTVDEIKQNFNATRGRFRA